MLLPSEVLKEEIVEKIKRSGSFCIHFDHITDTSYTRQLVTFIVYFDVKKGVAETKFVNLSDLLVLVLVMT